MTHRMMWCLATLCTGGARLDRLCRKRRARSPGVAKSFAELPRYVGVGDAVVVADQNEG
jgi:hypothetical protein